ncbi:MAG TPA: hypothetical protein QF753_09575 [Victivallales bacterium]|nr:hypothetical protein [Victivallales bacterium]
MIQLDGAAWLVDNIAGTLIKNDIIKYTNYKDLQLKLVDIAILNAKIKNLGRFNNIGKEYCLVSLLALNDASLNSFYTDEKRNIGVIGTDIIAAGEDNKKYFTDYIDSGRSLGRGNMFVYTLPSTPLGEVAIVNKLIGPIIYYNFLKKPLKNLMLQSEILLLDDQYEGMTLLFNDETGKICFVVSKKDSTAPSSKYNFQKLIAAVDKNDDVKSLVNYLDTYKEL